MPQLWGWRKGRKMNQLLDRKDCGRILKLSRNTIYRLLLSGELPGFKIANEWRVRESDLKELIQRRIDQTERST